jgi:hypothetical protein
VISITTTLIETKKVRLIFIPQGLTFLYFVLQTVARMKEMSKLVCSMNVLKSGSCAFEFHKTE